MNPSKTVILAGAGHVHLFLASRAKDYLAQGARVILIDPDRFWYSGLATGMLGGMYSAQEDQVDPKSLIEANGGEFIQARMESVDHTRQTVRLSTGTELHYDCLSVNIGSQVNLRTISEAEGDPTVWPVKPVSNLWKLREELTATTLRDNAFWVVVVGGGATGVEVAANLLGLSERLQFRFRVILATSSDRLMKQLPASAADALEKKLKNRGLTIFTRTRVVRRAGKTLITDNRSTIPADHVVVATGLQANPMVANLGLPVTAYGELRINAKLHSVADDRVFAGGDCAALEGHHLPKLGVYGVRQAPYVHRNLLARLKGQPLTEFRPQKRYLIILNLGDGTALATWGPFWWNGRSSMWLKDQIDRRFLSRYQQQSATPPSPED